MRLEIYQWKFDSEYNYCIIISNKLSFYTTNFVIADYCGLKDKEYESILINNGAIYDKYEFKYLLKYKDAEKVVEILNPYLIMEKLTKN